jgi:hypothetical protein
MLLGTDEQLTRRQRDPIGTHTVERLRSTLLDRRRVRHVGDDSLGRFDWIVLVVSILGSLSSSACRSSHCSTFHTL